MPEQTPRLDIEALAEAAFDAENASIAAEWRDEIWADERRKQGYSRAYRIAEAVATRRDQAWQTALDARTTALRQARDDVQRLRVTAMDIYVQCARDGQRERVTKHLRKIDEVLATIEVALGGGEP